ncbi:MAG TPA: carbohydrate binding family 9 domain-containing protein, partial [Bacteroidales bacterium]|nr:carbohydrate binding family 9 domain-containing protein [Bacteroidales bacterium]
MKRIMMLAVSAFLCFVTAAQTPENKKSYKAVYTASQPVIDGSIDEEIWQAGDWGGDFVQFEPNNGSDASQKTEFKVLFDDNYIYVAIKAFDTAPDSISRRISRRDNADGDLVGIAFDSYHDQRTGFVFIVNAAGVKLDMIWASDGQVEDETWDPIWFTKSGVYDWGWAAEMKIPLTQLRFRISEGGI